MKSLLLTAIISVATTAIVRAMLSIPRPPKPAEPPPPYGYTLPQLPDDQLDIAAASFILAKELNPSIDIPALDAQLDAIVEHIRWAVDNNPDPGYRIQVINTTLFFTEQFGYDFANYKKYVPGVSQLADILARKRGNCAALATLYLAVAQRLGYPIYPVFTPTHVYLRYVKPDLTFINIDPTDFGREISDAEYIRHFNLPKEGVRSGIYLHTSTYREFLGFVLSIYAMEHRRNSLVRTIRYLEGSIEMNPFHTDAMAKLFNFYNLAALAPGCYMQDWLFAASRLKSRVRILKDARALKEILATEDSLK